MRLLIYTNAFPPNIGGQETYNMVLARGLTEHLNSASPMQVTIATPVLANGYDDAALPFAVVRTPGLSRLCNLIRETDVVHLAGAAFVPLTIALALQKPVVIEHHGFQAICPNGQMFHQPTRMPCPGHFMAGEHRQCIRCNLEQGTAHSIRLWLLTFPRRWLCRRVRVNILPTEWLSSQLNLPRMQTVHHGMNKSRPPAPKPGPGIPMTFAFQGRLVSTKGVNIIVEAASVLKARGLSFRLLVIGDGPARVDLQQLVAGLNLDDCVRFLGYLPPEALESALDEADAVCMPSLGGEVFGLVALENMLRAKLVIVSDIGSLVEVVGDTGVHCPPGDPEAWADAMERIIRDPNQCAVYGGKASERALKLFTETEMISRHLEIYEQASKSKR
jgi:glycogen synthase